MWNLMKNAPRDGTIILATYKDFSAAHFIRWGTVKGLPDEEAWFKHDWQGEMGQDDDFLGWIYPPTSIHCPIFSTHSNKST